MTPLFVVAVCLLGGVVDSPDPFAGLTMNLPAAVHLEAETIAVDTGKVAGTITADLRPASVTSISRVMDSAAGAVPQQVRYDDKIEMLVLDARTRQATRGTSQLQSVGMTAEEFSLPPFGFVRCARWQAERGEAVTSEVVGGVRTIKVPAPGRGRGPFEMEVDEASGRIQRIVTTSKNGRIEYVLSDYRRLADGTTYPFECRRTISGELLPAPQESRIVIREARPINAQEPPAKLTLDADVLVRDELSRQTTDGTGKALASAPPPAASAGWSWNSLFVGGGVGSFGIAGLIWRLRRTGA